VAAKVHLEGYKETIRALNKINKDAKKRVFVTLATAAEPVAGTARDKISRYQGASLTTIMPRATMRGVFVVQNARKVSGLRPDFGKLQMMEGLIPALDEHEDTIVREVELALDVLGVENGF
jgi:hypothetical protein